MDYWQREAHIMSGEIKPKKLKTILFVLFFVVFVDQAGILVIVPVIPSLLHELTGQSVEQNAVWGGALVAVYGFMQFIFAPVMGSLSDRFGRRALLLACTLFAAIDYFIIAIAPNVWILFLGRMLAGIAGASMVPAMAGVADVSTPMNKTKNYAFVYSAVGLGMIMGPVLTAMVVDLGTRAPFWLSMAIAFVNFLFVWKFFPETLAPENRRSFKFKNPISSIMSIGKYKGLYFLFLSLFIYMVAFETPMVLLAFYSKSHFGWSDNIISYLYVLLGVVMVLTQMVLLPKLFPILGNKNLYYMAFYCFIASMFFMGVAWVWWMMVLALVLVAMSGIANSINANIFSSAVSPQQQGEVQGALSSVYSLGAIIGPFIASWQFKFFASSGLPLGDGLVFIVAGLLGILSFYFTILAFRQMKDNPALNQKPIAKREKEERLARKARLEEMERREREAKRAWNRPKEDSPGSREGSGDNEGN